MSMTVLCRECGENFRKFSLKSRERICPDCRGKKGKNRYRVMSNRTQDAITTMENIDKEIKNLKTSIDVLHSTIEVEVQHQLTKGIEPIIEKILDEKISELKDIVVSSMTKAKKTQNEVNELRKLIKGYKGSNTRMKNIIKKFEEGFER